MKNCPRDNTPLTFISNQKDKFYYCEKCHGIWLSLKNMQTSLSIDVEEYMKILLNKAIKMPTAEDKKITCDCYHNTKMNKVSIKNIYIDICPNCKGTRFDNGELVKIKNIMKQDKQEKKHNGLKTTKNIITENLGWLLKFLLIDANHPKNPFLG